MSEGSTIGGNQIKDAAEKVSLDLKALLEEYTDLPHEFSYADKSYNSKDQNVCTDCANLVIITKHIDEKISEYENKISDPIEKLHAQKAREYSSLFVQAARIRAELKHGRGSTDILTVIDEYITKVFCDSLQANDGH